MNNRAGVLILSILSASLYTAATAMAADSAGEPGRSAAGKNPLKNVYFGEEHMHTRNSFDAVSIGVRQTWEDAYRYAMGEEVTQSTTGIKIRRRTPYDFVAITDHSEYFGVLKDLLDPKSPLSKSEFAQGYAAGLAGDPAKGQKYMAQLIGTLLSNTPMPEYVTPELRMGNWERYVDTANKWNKPGKFTTLIAYEWTSIPDGANMHRNVFFRDKAPLFAFSAFDSIYPEDLWTYLEIQRNAGIEAFAIPHNSNVSDGWMFSSDKFLAGPMDERYARRQQQNEPLFEIAQIKGQSEAHPLLSPYDEFADYEQWPNLINLPVVGQVKNSFYRQGLAEGFLIERKTGYNPYKMGVVGGSDAHSGYQPNEEFNFVGGHGTIDDTPQKRLNPAINATALPAPIPSSAATTAVWAEENTREAIFDAMKSKETYGTSGTLIRLRFFGGWDYPNNLVKDRNFVEKAYEGGVPMGQDLPAKAGKAPTFAVWALKDPESGNLDRIQIVKMYLNTRTNTPAESIYDVALSDNRRPGPDGKVPPVGNTVDIKTATYTNDIGDSQLMAVWTDPDFNPNLRAAYYVRVLEIPTPRWSTYDAARLGIPTPDDIVSPTIQERAWSSPIWYTPSEAKTAKK